MVFAQPSIVFVLLLDRLGTESAGRPQIVFGGFDDLVREPWSPADWTLWWWPLLAIVLPTWIHSYVSKRMMPAHRIERGEVPGPGYRNASTHVAHLCQEGARRRRSAYALRLGCAVGISMIPVLRLLSTSVVAARGCIRPPVLSIPTYLIEATLILIALVFHIPTNRRLLGPAPVLSKKT